MVTKNTVFTVRTLGKVGTRLVTDTAIGRARAMSITLASWWTEVPYKLMTCKYHYILHQSNWPYIQKLKIRNSHQSVT